MLKKILLGTVMSAALTVGVPMAASAATTANTTTLNAGVVSPQVRIRIGQPRRRWRRDDDRRWENRRYVARYRVVPQYYWMNGRRYVRYVRVRNF
ncbi:MAG: hypothetical protein ABI999_02320 [Acidobacteriota bacterium]